MKLIFHTSINVLHHLQQEYTLFPHKVDSQHMFIPIVLQCFATRNQNERTQFNL